MKTRSAQADPPNIAAIVKARHHARVVCPQGATSYSGVQPNYIGVNLYDVNESNCASLNSATVSTCDDAKPSIDEKPTRTRSENPPRAAWSADDRRLFFQGVRIHGRNFTEITRFIRSRGHRSGTDGQSSAVGFTNPSNESYSASSTSNNPTTQPTTLPVLPNAIGSNTSSTTAGNVSQTNPISYSTCTNSSELNTSCGGLTREQVRFFYQQTWHKIRRYIKFPEEVPQHVREVYAIINYSVLRTRIKKAMDNRLGEKLNELVHYGTTVIKHNGRRCLLRTPVCLALKQLNNISAPTHEYLLPEDVWIELVPRTQSDAWRVIEAEQNPRLRLRVDINHQLYDVINLVENKWQLAAERVQKLFELRMVTEYSPPSLLLRLCPMQTIDGAIRLQEVARVRPGDIGLRAYLEGMCSKRSNPLTSTVPDPTPTESINENPHISPPTLSDSSRLNAVASSANSTVELDLRKLGRKLSLGVTCEAARGIKLVTIYLAIGCPDRIRFEYEFVCVNSTSSNPYHGLIAYQPSDPDGDGLSNGLRRLLHLNASDYLLHRDWVSRYHSTHDTSSTTVSTSILQTQPVQTFVHSLTTHETNAPVIANTANYQNVRTVLTPIQLTTSVAANCGNLDNQICMNSQDQQQTMVTFYPNYQPIHVLSNVTQPMTTVPTLIAGNSTVAVKTPKLVLLPQPVGQKVPVIERQLDHDRPMRMNQVPAYISLTSNSNTTPLSEPVNHLTAIGSELANNMCAILKPNSIANVSEPSTSSSLKSLKAFNTKRRTSMVTSLGSRLCKSAKAKLSPRISNLMHANMVTTVASASISVQPPVQTTPSTINLQPILSDTLDLVSTPCLQNSNQLSMMPDANADALLLLTDTNQSSSRMSHDTLASLLNTVYQRGSSTDQLFYLNDSSTLATMDYVHSDASQTHQQLIPYNEAQLTPVMNVTTATITTPRITTSSTSNGFITTDDIAIYPCNSQTMATDIAFTESMAAAVLNMHPLELGHNDSQQSTNPHFNLLTHQQLESSSDSRQIDDKNDVPRDYTVTNVKDLKFLKLDGYE